ncbi:golgi apyrase [[Candida] anglica]|uniref:Golgi apyrase n=1 Tax=[Candida] anglica TaxID=148631 RepID=A0ABP0EI99_9ASCO
MDDHFKYGIVIDSGSSGSRIQIYKWEDYKYTLEHSNGDNSKLQSPPKIIQEKDWTLKIKPGISTYADKTRDIWPTHYQKLLRYAEEIIPQEKHRETPVFVLATAGMRLLPHGKQRKILKETCESIRSNTEFSIPNCSDFVQVIDGETEGLYGWLGLNYLMGQFDNYSSDLEKHESIGFMDMGGASTQIAFVPSSDEEVKKHDEDLSTVVLRSVNGETQKWRVFVETWLGFGANEARRRYLNQLINVNISAPPRAKMKGSQTVSDPCLPQGAEFPHVHEGKTYKIKGIGNYQQCVKSIYPLLLKNIPCTDTPCLFNGIHGPKLNFDDDKFIGISEYWYTANDIFQSGGEYNYHAFNNKVKEFCESDWSTILQNSANGQYSNLDPETFLRDACFKASWVMNVLHEGFELPRLDVDATPETDKSAEELAKELTNKHIPFKSADSVNGDELSWTLGKMLLFASSQIRPGYENDKNVGIYPSEISGQDFVPGGGSTRYISNHQDGKSDYDSDLEDILEGQSFFIVPFILILLIVMAVFARKSKIISESKLKKIPVYCKDIIMHKIPYFKNWDGYAQMREREQENYDLEEGLRESNGDGNKPVLQQPYPQSVLRTRSTMNLSINEEEDGSQEEGRHGVPNFLHKPFLMPKRNASNSIFQFSDLGSRESLPSLGRTPSSASLKKFGKGVE